jgi:anti-anti-sigma factor
VVLYTDGLIERRSEVLDVGLDRLRQSAAAHAGDGPEHLVAALLAEALDERGAHDDVAIIAARVMPAPLHQRVPARAESLGPLRRMVEAWGRAAGLDGDRLDDLQLALGEAAANAVEHAYRGGDPPQDRAEFDRTAEFAYTLQRLADGSVAASVRDFGTWQPPLADPGYRGRGIAMVHAIASTAAVEPGPTGTTVRFTLAPPVAPPFTPAGDDRPTAGRPARVVTEAGRVALHGDIDPPAAAELRAELLAAVASGDGKPVVLDLDAVTYLASAGVGLVFELTDRAREADVPLDLHATPGSIAARVLTLTGLAALARQRRERQKEAAGPG